MSRIFALSWTSVSLIVFLAALHKIDALTCRRCVGSYFARNWKHFIFPGEMPPKTDDCGDHLDALPEDPAQRCESEVCLDFFIWNMMANPGDEERYSHLRGCAEDLLGKPIPKPTDPLMSSYCDYNVTAWCSPNFNDESSPFNIVCGDTNQTHASLCTTNTGSEPACNNQFNYYKTCREDPKTNPCVVCDKSANDTVCENHRIVNAKWCTTTTISRGSEIISVERGATAANAYGNEGNLTRTIEGLTYTIDYCKTPYCNSIDPWTGTSTTTTAPTSTGPTVASTEASSTVQPQTTKASSAKTEATTVKLASSIVASAFAVGFCAVLSTLFGR